MRDINKVFHLAIPCKDLDETVDFYQKLGCQLSRRYQDRVTFNFFGDQLVCHLNPENIDKRPRMYPRHFGITFKEIHEFNETIAIAKSAGLLFFHEEMIRFAGKKEEHATFFLQDPSNNLLEFKYYNDKDMIY